MKKKFKLAPLSITQRLSASFLIVIMIGSFLLSLPIMHYPHAPKTTFLEHLFTSASMVSVTGLAVFPIGDVYNGFGQTIAIILMQIGGLGLVSLIAFSYYTLRKKISITDQTMLQSSLSKDSSKDLKRYLYSVYKLTFFIEAFFALILMFDFIPHYGWKNGIFNSIFLSVSAFCNAGFDNLGSNSLGEYTLNPIINFSVAFLIISGGLGFGNWRDIIHRLQQFIFKRPRNVKLTIKKLSIQTKLVLSTTMIILTIGTFLSWLFEHDNPATIGNYNFFQQIMVSFFQTVTMRTAGFSTIDFTQTNFATNFVYMVQMIIGGAPGGTAGGVKITVAAILFLLFKAELRGRSEVTFNYRSFSQRLIKQTLTVLIFYFIVLITGYLLLLEFEKSLNPFALLFETISALATVGVSMNLTPELSNIGRLIIMSLMFIGRVGPVTVLLSLRQRQEKTIHYAKTDIFIG
ncbi:TrkH family potassium uptake protein [Streptococcus marimammalium]|uniref:TrkH family potassium uptake protein n=1 Tax=Streptococcus marimammalium TaxID=269666 RepID=UPI000369C73F|nr:potassium transporter TrkG [Streptococcus marimammalium]